MQAEIDPAEPQKEDESGKKKGKTKQHPAFDLLIGAILLVMGLFFGVDDFGEAWDDHRLVADGVRTQGLVTEVNFESSGRRSTSKVMSVSYEDDSRVGHSMTYSEPYRSKEEGSRAEVESKITGTEVTVFHDRSDPGKAVVEGDEQSFGMAIFRGGFFILLSPIFLVPGIRGLRKKKPAAPEVADADSPEAATSSGT